MKSKSLIQGLGKWMLVLVLSGIGLCIAAPEPTLQQVYSTAQAGKLDEAQVMIQQVLITHPESAKAFFVQAELHARQGHTERARESLALAEKFAPGLPFAKAEAVQALRAQLARSSAAPTSRQPTSLNSSATQTPDSPSSSSWQWPLLLGGGVILAAYFLFRKKPPQVLAAQASFADRDGLSGPHIFGAGAGAMQPAYPQGTGYSTPNPPQAGSGLGGRIMGGVATGLAVGAGVMAAEAIGRNLMGNHNASGGLANDSNLHNDGPSVPNDYGMGGTDFGLNDTSSWDDGASADVGGGSGDWDN